MKYTYDTCIDSPIPLGVASMVRKKERVATTTDLNELTENNVHDGKFVVVTDNETGREVATLCNVEDLDDWRLGQERAWAWKPEKRERITESKPEDFKVRGVPLSALRGIHVNVNEDEEAEVDVATYLKIPQETRLPYEKLKKLFIKNLREQGRLPKDAVNPDHYQGYVDQLQWMETLEKIYHDRFEEFNVALEVQIRKYLDRLGKKDDKAQELQKALWYLKLLTARVKTGRNVMIDEIEDILSD